MSVRIGYACIALGVAGAGQMSCNLSTATQSKLRSIILHNLNVLEKLVAYNAANGIKLFRISSDLIPFGSSDVNTLMWQEEFCDRFHMIGDEIARTKTRVSMHPGQYTVLNSPDLQVVERAVADLIYHDQVLRLLKTDNRSKIILHVGGVYGDKNAALERFYENWKLLNDSVKSRIALENDERCYNIEEVLQLSDRLGVPVVFDGLHHAILPPKTDKPITYWIDQCAKTWKEKDGRQKLHYSQQSEKGKQGTHSGTIAAEQFLTFYEHIKDREIDLMLEVKDKNLSAIKCQALISKSNVAVQLTQEWARYEHLVLEHSPKDYQTIRTLLKGKETLPALRFYTLVEHALNEPVSRENAVRAALYVWGHFKSKANGGEKKRFTACLERYQNGKAALLPVKNLLYRMAEKYREKFLLNSYYFL